MTALGWFAVVFLILANGYFVAAEFSFVASRRSKFVERADNGDRRSRRAVEVHRRLSFMLSGAQFGITATSLVLGFIAEPVIADTIRPALDAVGVPESAVRGVSIVIALVLATTAQMVFGELAPKNLAIAEPEAVARAVAPSTLLYLRLFGPIVRLFDSSANRLLRILGIEPVDELVAAVSPEELGVIVDSSAESGHLTVSQAALLERAMDFSELEASEAMIPWKRVITIDASASAADLRDLMDTSHSRFPVVDSEGEVVGVVHAKDLLGVGRDDYDRTPVADIIHEVVAVPEAAGLSVVLASLRERSTEMALVVDEYGAPAGVITLEDIVEELVGDIEDEYDRRDHNLDIEVEPGVWLLGGTIRPDEIERLTGYVLPEGEYDTVAGLVLDHLERIPVVGDQVDIDGVLITVESLDAFAIDRIRLAPSPHRATDVAPGPVGLVAGQRGDGAADASPRGEQG
jgi:CBS domain containing-hemolysin-like protein